MEIVIYTYKGMTMLDAIGTYEVLRNYYKAKKPPLIGNPSNYSPNLVSSPPEKESSRKENLLPQQAYPQASIWQFI